MDAPAVQAASAPKSIPSSPITMSEEEAAVAAKDIMKDTHDSVEESIIHMQTTEIRLLSVSRKLKRMHDLGYDITELATMVGSQLTVTKDAWAKCWEAQDRRTKDLIDMSLMQSNLTASSSGETGPHSEPPGPPPGPGPAHPVVPPRPEANPANVKPPEPVSSDADMNFIDKPEVKCEARTDLFGARRPGDPV